MNKALFALSAVGVVGVTSICDLCTSRPAHVAPALVATAQAATLPSQTTPAVISPVTDAKTITLHVDGMTCGGCVIGVRKVLTRLNGVSKADVSYEKQRAVVTYDPVKVTVDQMIAAIKTLGYKATAVTSRARS